MDSIQACGACDGGSIPSVPAEQHWVIRVVRTSFRPSKPKTPVRIRYRPPNLRTIDYAVIFKYQNGQISSMQALGLVGTAIGFGSFGYSVVRLYERNWKAAVGGIAVGAVALSLVGWNMNKLKDTVPFMADGDFMNPKDVEKILDESRGKIVSVTFVKRTTGEERTLVGRIGKKYKPTGTDPLGGKAARRKRNLFTIYDMQKGGFRMVSMDSVLSIKAAGKRHHG